MNMSAQTVTTERKTLIETINALSDAAILKLAPYAAFLRYEDEIPNAETIAAIEEARAGLDEPTTLEEILAECHALSKNNQVI
jgi:type IV secretory pathway VirB4 component